MTISDLHSLGAHVVLRTGQCTMRTESAGLAKEKRRARAGLAWQGPAASGAGWSQAPPGFGGSSPSPFQQKIGARVWIRRPVAVGLPAFSPLQRAACYLVAARSKVKIWPNCSLRPSFRLATLPQPALSLPSLAVERSRRAPAHPTPSPPAPSSATQDDKLRHNGRPQPPGVRKNRQSRRLPPGRRRRAVPRLPC